MVVDVTSALPHSIEVLTASRKVVTVRIKYPWRPTKCVPCKVFGHNECNKKMVAEIESDKIAMKAPSVAPNMVLVMKASKDDALAGFVSTTPVLPTPTTPVPVRIVQNSLAPVQMLLLSVVMNQKSFVVSFVYGFNQVGAKRQLWDELRMGLGLVGNQPWIVLGDFNAVRWQQERSDPTTFYSASAGEFNCCSEDIGVEELNSTHPWFTWSNKRLGNDHRCSRIDKALVNS
ncbi:hypothetical protein RHMOL_Rhmol02G0277600 [Rhododendron molle]|uniref:Uncharacterized protein n=1 Tax=Rhododendron molle TaxID=49168 RepID=A0ACC0PW77_RHOML|nr:hypothetical protein RHMOL_Rhmol02G0277600 [Rhododendron molle]